MKIVLSGVETRNKGAELMIYAILQETERRYPKASVYFDAGSIPQGLSYIKTSLHLKEKPVEIIHKWFYRLRIQRLLSILGLGLIERKYLEDIYSIRHSSYFLDASGFHFSDQWEWPEERMNNKKKLWEAQKREGSKIVFLPQAFGPFNKERSKRYLASMSGVADLIIARDKISYAYLEASGVVDLQKVKLYPDFTSLVHGDFPEEYSYLKQAVCIIPNCRMFDKGTVGFEDYLSILSSIIHVCEESGNKIYLLNHEGVGDEKLANRIKESISGNIDVVTGINGLQVKGLISSAKLVITSRFHGAASALNSCVPCLATSWSHKYEELFNSYDLKNCVLDLNKKDEIIDKVKEQLDSSNNKKIRAHLSGILPIIQEKTEEMWKQVWSC